MSFGRRKYLHHMVIQLLLQPRLLWIGECSMRLQRSKGTKASLVEMCWLLRVCHPCGRKVSVAWGLSDGLLEGCPGGGVLEVKCPYNKGKPELGLPWETMPFYYMPQGTDVFGEGRRCKGPHAKRTHRQTGLIIEESEVGSGGKVALQGNRQIAMADSMYVYTSLKDSTVYYHFESIV
ncbi:hypothetical protein IFM89_024870 [Coptis chinensis]|uniref:YqaJ viral recombinase domain-containing protein n=1 Tax=Coptis chinensis TaxID=261450 RepID=A0A835HQ11_9MAGN|nr:hypothetical protein IFM89_024870 [Coptis chinensis]